MGTLFRYELKKLLSRKLTWLMLAVCVGILVNFDAGMIGFSYVGDYVRGMRDVYAKYEGRVLTEALAAQAQADSESFAAAHAGEFETLEDGELSPKGPNRYYDGAWRAFGDVAQSTTVERYREMAASMQGILDSGFYDNGKPLTQSDRSRLESEIAFINSEPPVVHYAEGWKMMELCNQMLGVFPLFLLALCLAPLFSGERTAKMEDIMMCAAKRRQAASAKLLAAISATLSLFIVFYGMQLLAVALTYGLDGVALSAFYCGGSYVYTDRTLFGLFAGGALVALAAMLALASLSALFSAAFRNTLVAMIAYAGLVAMHFVSVSILGGGLWALQKGPVWKTVSNIIYLLPGNVLNDGNGGFQINTILTDPLYVAIGLLLSLSIAAAAAGFTQALYLKRRKA